MNSGGAQGAVDSVVEAIYRRYFVEVCRRVSQAYGQGPPDPQDAVQGAFVKLAGLDDPAKVKDPRAWLFITARNIIFDQKKRTKRDDAYILEQLTYDGAYKFEEITPERVLIERERFSLLASAMQRLPHRQKVVLTMSRLQGKTYEEIRLETGWSMGDISLQVTNGMAALYDVLERQGALKRTPVNKLNRKR